MMFALPNGRDCQGQGGGPVRNRVSRLFFPIAGLPRGSTWRDRIAQRIRNRAFCRHVAQTRRLRLRKGCKAANQLHLAVWRRYSQSDEGQFRVTEIMVDSQPTAIVVIRLNHPTAGFRSSLTSPRPPVGSHFERATLGASGPLPRPTAGSLKTFLRAIAGSPAGRDDRDSAASALHGPVALKRAERQSIYGRIVPLVVIGKTARNDSRRSLSGHKTTTKKLRTFSMGRTKAKRPADQGEIKIGGLSVAALASVRRHPTHASLGWFGKLNRN